MLQPIPIHDTSVKTSPSSHAGFREDQCVQLASVLKALSDPVRLQLFAAIAASPEPVCVCHIPDVGVGQPTVSHHLRKLREAGLIECARRGTWVDYWVTEAGKKHAGHVRALLD